MRVGDALPIKLKEPGFEGARGWSPGKLEDGAADANRRFCSLAEAEDTNSDGNRKLVLGLRLRM
jgi:hypothetical protein